MSPTYVVVPQWQGSVSTRAMRLSDGADAIRGDLPASVTRLVEVPSEAGDALGTGVHRYSALRTVRERMSAALDKVPDWALTIGGDCGVSLAAIESASLRHPGDLAVVWFDAHADLHTPESSLSGAFTGMVLRAISGEGADGLRLGAGSVPLDRVVLAGTRDLDPAEDALIAERGVVSLDVDAVASVGALADAVRATGASMVYLHIDLDVLDPAELQGLANPLPFGVSIQSLSSAVAELRAQFGLAGATIAGFSPASPDAADDDLSAILRLIGALTR